MYPYIQNGKIYFSPGVNVEIGQEVAIPPVVASALIIDYVPTWQRDSTANKSTKKIIGYATGMLNIAKSEAGKNIVGKEFKEKSAVIKIAVELDADNNIVSIDVIDGQHTLKAVILSGVTIHSDIKVIYTESAAESLGYFDVQDHPNSVRTEKDVIKARGMVERFGLSVSEISKVNKAALCIESYGLLRNADTDEQLRDYDLYEARIERWYKLASKYFKAVATCKLKWKQTTTIGGKKNSKNKLMDDKFVACFLFLLRYGEDEEQVWEFINGIASNANDTVRYPKGDPRQAIIQWLQEIGQNGWNVWTADVIYTVFKCWGQFVSRSKNAGLTDATLPKAEEDRKNTEDSRNTKVAKTVARDGLGGAVVLEAIRSGIPKLPKLPRLLKSKLAA